MDFQEFLAYILYSLFFIHFNCLICEYILISAYILIYDLYIIFSLALYIHIVSIPELKHEVIKGVEPVTLIRFLFGVHPY